MSLIKLVLIVTENQTMQPTPNVSDIVEIGVIAERAGFDAVMASEHVVMGPSANELGLPSNPRDYAYPGNQLPDTFWPSPLVVLSGIAQATSRIRLVFGAMIAPLRHPLHIAKEVGTLDRLSGGRVVLMPTVSWHRDEYRALGVSFHERGAILDEQLEVLVAAWSGVPFAHHGRFFDFDEIWVEPQPARRSGPPMWFGGSSVHAKVIDRLVRYGSGFNPLGSPSDEEMARLDEALTEHGRSLTELELIGGTRGVFPDERSVAPLDTALASIPRSVARGYRTICIKPSQFIDRLDRLERFCIEVVERVDALDLGAAGDFVR